VSFELPPNATLAAFDRALAAFDRVVGKEWVLPTDEDRGTYEDIYALQRDESHEPVARAALLVSWVFVPRAASRGTG
jgi:hypothetical protein